jgi:replication factor C subunit 2/4
MTQDAQSALRRIMETYSRITRFCLVCNYVTRSAILTDTSRHELTYRIIEPLASRCSKFRFRPLAQVSSEARIQMIANAEGVQADDGVSYCFLLSELADLIGTTAYPGAC